MKIATIAMGIGLSAFLMTGCSGDPATKTDAADSKPDITGKWIYNAPTNQKGCINNGHGFSDRYRLEINATHIVFASERFSEENCDASALDMNITYTSSYTIGAKTTLHLYDANASAQSQNFTSVDGYELDTTLISISLHYGTFDSLPETGKKIYFSFRLDGQKLYMPIDTNSIHDGETKENRVVEIGTGYFWTKQ